jgi:hypothetical protein
MIENSAYVKSELAYRSQRLRTEVAGRRRGHVRNPFARKPAESTRK